VYVQLSPVIEKCVKAGSEIGAILMRRKAALHLTMRRAPGSAVDCGKVIEGESEEAATRRDARGSRISESLLSSASLRTRAYQYGEPE
jgi:hypothetical protein